jgi:hypothetical protein
METYIFDELSSCEASEDYYENKIMELSLSERGKSIDVIEMDVDRGVDFRVLKGLLIRFPNLKNIEINQNYSPSNAVLDHFIEFVSALKLEKLKFADLQSEFLDNVDPKTLFEQLPGNCIYIIHHGFFDSKGYDGLSLTTHIDPFNNKYMTFTRSKK